MFFDEIHQAVHGRIFRIVLRPGQELYGQAARGQAEAHRLVISCVFRPGQQVGGARGARTAQRDGEGQQAALELAIDESAAKGRAEMPAPRPRQMPGQTELSEP